MYETLHSTKQCHSTMLHFCNIPLGRFQEGAPKRVANGVLWPPPRVAASWPTNRRFAGSSGCPTAQMTASTNVASWPHAEVGRRTTVDLFDLAANVRRRRGADLRRAPKRPFRGVEMRSRPSDLASQFVLAKKQATLKPRMARKSCGEYSLHNVKYLIEIFEIL